ncbi:hypothetical protein D039_4095B, partial [Vibrio parahaemolyticus EKP-028]
TLAGG